MPIPLACSCHHSFRIKDELAGKKIRCPACSTVIAVPLPEAELIEDEQDVGIIVLDAPAPLRSSPPPLPSETFALTEEEPPTVLPANRKALRRQYRERPLLSRKSRSHEGSGFGNIHAGVLGGIVMMVIAVVWFTLGLMGGILFYYPPVLLVIGFIAVIKGLVGGND